MQTATTPAKRKHRCEPCAVADPASTGVLNVNTVNAHEASYAVTQARDIRQEASELVARISLLKGCLPSCFGFTGEALLQAALTVDTLAGVLGCVP